MISQLHAGKSVEEVKGKFNEAFGNVSVNEITQAEQALIAEGLPVQEIQWLCDVHAAVFKGSIEEIHQPSDPSEIPGHPVSMLPMLLENLTQDEWMVIADGSGEFGYCLLQRVPVWRTYDRSEAASSGVNGVENNTKGDAEAKASTGIISFPTGELRIEELVRMLDTLPIDITFVDRNDSVTYFSQNAERIFPRVRAIIGRKVAACHPPASVHVVEGIVKDFKSGKKDHEDFWINMGGKYVYIRYFAVRSESGEYLGTMEVTQDIKPVQDITGEKRLVSDERP